MFLSKLDGWVLQLGENNIKSELNFRGIIVKFELTSLFFWLRQVTVCNKLMYSGIFVFDFPLLVFLLTFVTGCLEL